ncbi:MAG: hypothetical protein ACFWTW_02040 [Lentilactobacillus parabuchneri]|nr:hypothetical protein FAM21838_00843 [Lentilactobacillus parabuchneri]ORN27976.1 hypothetical protein FAM21835_00892 [Lentilactobacillus parabuchneri]ORN33884.1 hypothetical protein FAM23280_00892 [Lentilactobacillus parabuchneri]ORN34368.1 hypothetical protein FAM23279_00926 [Lentilactobacillus parabuchneri]ORN37465.1 hypothetical protein FAM23281_00923 [Lentilactobacillus parabuchneri]
MDTLVLREGRFLNVAILLPYSVRTEDHKKRLLIA